MPLTGALPFIKVLSAQAVVARARQLTAPHGARFEPAAVVVKQAQAGERFAHGLDRRRRAAARQAQVRA